MSFNLESLQKQISGGEDLASIVRTMKALAATSVRQYEKAAESLDDYYRTVEMGLAVALTADNKKPAFKTPDSEKPVLCLVFGSDHGLAGRFNEQIVLFASQDYWKDSNNQALKDSCKFVAIGEQVINRLSAFYGKAEESFNMPSSVEAITPFVQLLLEKIETLRSNLSAERVILFYNRPQTAGFLSQAEELLPVNLKKLYDTRMQWKSRSLPTFNLPREKLLSLLIRQYFFVSVYRACALSLAAENVSRLAAMQAAEKNIDERLNELKTAYQQERQAAITEELLDIISGFKAGLRKKADSKK